MKTKLSVISSLLLVALCVTACGSQPATPNAEISPVEDYASLIDSLRAAGATVEPADPIEQPFFTVKGQIIKVNDEDVQVFEYESADALDADVAQISPDGGSTATTMITWMATPHFFKSGRVLVLYVGDDSAVLDLLKSALGEQFAGR